LKIFIVGGARPNFVKIAPIVTALSKAKKSHSEESITLVLAHTGQHSDFALSGSFFSQLGLPEPDYNLGVSGGGHGEQTGRIMQALEPVLIKENPDVLVVFGDVNSTLAASICASKLGIPVAHVESGLRSFDKTMPEEINRILTDSISDFLFVSEPSGIQNLTKEGVSSDRIFHVGNVMIDSLLSNLQHIEKLQTFRNIGLEKKQYILATLHRPSNVDDGDTLKSLLQSLREVALETNVVFPVHPRTRASAKKHGLEKYLEETRGFFVIEPQAYFDFISLLKNARLALTDSGGIQEESLVLGTPCVTLRENTERPVTLEAGMNMLSSIERAEMVSAIRKMENSERKFVPEFWDGHAADRIVAILLSKFLDNKTH
jgi:UDP-N-acetylglucosamine 2-epimerase (non-hydrolysing)